MWLVINKIKKIKALDLGLFWWYSQSVLLFINYALIKSYQNLKFGVNFVILKCKSLQFANLRKLKFCECKGWLFMVCKIIWFLIG